MDGALTQKNLLIRRLADKAARLYAPTVHSMAVLTAIFWLLAGSTAHDAIIAAIAVLIITCPCALALAVPAVQVVAAGALFRSKVLINAGDAIERIAGVDMVVFDKTGTLTLPELDVEIGLAGRLRADRARGSISLGEPSPARARSLWLGRRADPSRWRAGAPGPRGSRLLSKPSKPGSALRLSGNLEGAAAHLRRCYPEESAIAFRHGDETAVFRLRQRLRHRRGGGHSVTARARPFDHHLVRRHGRCGPEPRAGALGVKRWRADMHPGEKVAFLAELQGGGACSP